MKEGDFTHWNQSMDIWRFLTHQAWSMYQIIQSAVLVLWLGLHCCIVKYCYLKHVACT